MTTIIYSYTQGNKAYIGKTCDPYNRKIQHKKRFGNWDYKILDEIPSVKKEDWKPYECAWIQIYREWGYNMENKNNGGGGLIGFRTDEYKKQYIKQHRKQYHLDTYPVLKEKKIKQNRQYNLDNKEKVAEYMKEYDKQYRKTLKNIAYRKEYYQKNKETWK